MSKFNLELVLLRTGDGQEDEEHKDEVELDNTVAAFGDNKNEADEEDNSETASLVSLPGLCRAAEEEEDEEEEEEEREEERVVLVGRHPEGRGVPEEERDEVPLPCNPLLLLVPEDTDEDRVAVRVARLAVTKFPEGRGVPDEAREEDRLLLLLVGRLAVTQLPQGRVPEEELPLPCNPELQV